MEYKKIQLLNGIYKKYNIQKNDIVIAENTQSIDFFLLEFSLHLLGAIFVPLETKCTDNKIRDVKNLCNSKLVVLRNKRKIEAGWRLCRSQQSF